MVENEIIVSGEKNLTFPNWKSKAVDRAFRQKGLPGYINAEEIRKVLESIPQRNKRDYTLLYLLWTTGIRITEAISIKKRDIDLYNTTLRIRWLKKRERMERVLPLPSKTAYILSVFTGHLNEDNNVFPITRQRAFQIVKKYALLSGIQKRVHPHTFRHSYAVHFLKQTKNLPALQKLLGHSSIQTTMIYINLVQGDLALEVGNVNFDA
jgi:site-specific recombinase XerD